MRSKWDRQALSPSAAPAAIPQQRPDRALPPRPDFRRRAAQPPQARARTPASAPVGGQTGILSQNPGVVPITDSRPRFRPLAQNPDLWWQCS
jgi:hypothetical protein